mgnify:CR=1 FL=1
MDFPSKMIQCDFLHKSIKNPNLNFLNMYNVFGDLIPMCVPIEAANCHLQFAKEAWT